MIQVAIIGAGFIGPAHLELRRLGDVGGGACATAGFGGGSARRELNIAHAHDSVEALLAHPGQVVHNCTPNHPCPD